MSFKLQEAMNQLNFKVIVFSLSLPLNVRTLKTAYTSFYPLDPVKRSADIPFLFPYCEVPLLSSLLMKTAMVL